jgi:hypothetical protein
MLLQRPRRQGQGDSNQCAGSMCRIGRYHNVSDQIARHLNITDIVLQVSTIYPNSYSSPTVAQSCVKQAQYFLTFCSVQCCKVFRSPTPSSRLLGRVPAHRHNHFARATSYCPNDINSIFPPGLCNIFHSHLLLLPETEMSSFIGSNSLIDLDQRSLAGMQTPKTSPPRPLINFSQSPQELLLLILSSGSKPSSSSTLKIFS